MGGSGGTTSSLVLVGGGLGAFTGNANGDARYETVCCGSTVCTAHYGALYA